MSYIKKNEKQDASIIVIISIGFSILNLLTIVYYPKLLIISIIIVTFLLSLTGLNVVKIYIKMEKQYEVGNSYIKRKFSTIGTLFIACYTALVIFCYLLAQSNKGVALIIFLIGIFVPIDNLAINKLWCNYDKKKYYEIDRLNPSQKKYWNEPASIYHKRKRW